MEKIMEKRVKRLGYDVSFSPPGDGDFFYVGLGGKGFGNWNPGPEERDLRLSEEPPVWCDYSTYS